jgi:hypothetical protein
MTQTDVQEWSILNSYEKTPRCFGLELGSCSAQLAPLLGQWGFAQTLRMSPLLKISVLVHAECWYRPVSSAGLPTAREVP